MPEYLAPGVYVEEKDTGNKPIEGVSTSTVGFVGPTERGPDLPRLITSWPEFVRTYGGYSKAKFGAAATSASDAWLAYGVEGFFNNGGARCFVARVTSQAAGARAAEAKIKDGAGDVIGADAIGKGEWGNRIGYRVTDAALGTPRFKLEIGYWTVQPTVLDPSNAAFVPPALIEIYDNLSADPAAGDYFIKRVKGMSNLIDITTIAPNRRPVNNTSFVLFTLGNEGANLEVADFKGNPFADPGKRVGLAAIEEIDELSILSIPDEVQFQTVTATTVTSPIGDALIDQCERLKDRFAIINSPQSPPPIAAHRPSKPSRYAAYYYPGIKVYDPVARRETTIPPSGHVAGIYARVDIERGVHKAPANETVRGASDLQVQITKGQQEILNPRHVNCIRDFTGRGILVWGARCTVLDGEWKYINVRRLFIFIEESIEEGTQWVVFEPNEDATWARVRRSVTNFLTRVWRDGALMGRTPQEAFFVKCDRTTMTQDDIDNGRLIMIVGIAPVKPAEFVIIRIGQWAGGSDVTEL